MKTGNYDVYKQPFVALFSDGSASLSTNGQALADVKPLTYTPTGEASAPLVNVANLGCAPEDFPAEVDGNIALISRGECPFAQKVTGASAAGAVGAIVYNNVAGSLSGTLGGFDDAYVPAAGISLEAGQDLVAQLSAGTVVNGELQTESTFENRTTFNVIAQTKGGDKNNVIMSGSHTDSVVAGPGINDNGSGSIALLELATKLAYFKTTNAVRFAWWSAEEFGLLGAEHYVTTLPSAELDKIRLYLNFDMIASPNYVYGVYDGNGDAFNISGPAGSAEAEKLFEDFYKSKHLPSVPSAFDGRSDYGPFLDAGVAAGGLFTGAEKEKTEEEQKMFGGEAGKPYDANYHMKGDDITNLNYEAFVVNTKAIANSIATYARSFKSLPPRARRVVKEKREEHAHGAIQRCGEEIVAQ
jgi:Zn-dependent M28 family amino/carboxypeptidase